MEFNGLPLHPLVVHVAVMLGPVAAFTSLAYAVLPGWRWLLRWPMVVLAASAAGAIYVAKLAGEDLLEKRPFLLDSAPLRDRIELHQERGDLLFWIALGFVAVTLLAAWSLGGPSGLTSGKGERAAKGSVVSILAFALVVVGAIAMVVMTYLTGDAGARAVWEQ